MMEKVTLELEFGEAKELLATWETSLQELQASATELERRIQLTKDRIASLRAKIQGQELLTVSPSGEPRQPGVGRGNTRSPRGHNLKLVRTFLEGIAPEAKSAVEIARGVNVGQTSVQAVLARYPGLFEQTTDKRWKLRIGGTQNVTNQIAA